MGISVNYNLNHSPSPVGINIRAQIRQNKISITLCDIPAIWVTASPDFSGSILSSVISALVTPIANIITVSIGAFASELLNNKQFDIGNIPEINFDVGGATLHLDPVNLNLEHYGDMLMLSGDLNIR
jgi:hypothetical protein